MGIKRKKERKKNTQVPGDVNAFSNGLFKKKEQADCFVAFPIHITTYDYV